MIFKVNDICLHAGRDLVRIVEIFDGYEVGKIYEVKRFFNSDGDSFNFYTTKDRLKCAKHTQSALYKSLTKEVK